LFFNVFSSHLIFLSNIFIAILFCVDIVVNIVVLKLILFGVQAQVLKPFSTTHAINLNAVVVRVRK
jgi:hypothetical protein